MAGIQIVDATGRPFRADGDKFNAQRIARRPLDYNNGTINGGSYGCTLTGTVNAGIGVAASDLFQFRWASSTKQAVIQEILLEGAYATTAATTAGGGRLEVFPARAWTADTASGTAAVLSGNNGKLDTDEMSTSELATFGGLRITSGAALTAGTKTVDSQAIGAITAWVPNALGQIFPNNPLFQPDDLHPLILRLNEGFVIRAIVPAVMVWQFSMTIRWSELASYK